MHSAEPLFGMPPEALYAWGTLRDDEGDLHSIMRRIPHDGAASSRRRLVVQSTVGGAECLRIHPLTGCPLAARSTAMASFLGVALFKGARYDYKQVELFSGTRGGLPSGKHSRSRWC
jgi:hypothetical protein